MVLTRRKMPGEPDGGPGEEGDDLLEFVAGAKRHAGSCDPGLPGLLSRSRGAQLETVPGVPSATAKSLAEVRRALQRRLMNLRPRPIEPIPVALRRRQRLAHIRWLIIPDGVWCNNLLNNIQQVLESLEVNVQDALASILPVG